jgi:hypothetical protein
MKIGSKGDEEKQRVNKQQSVPWLILLSLLLKRDVAKTSKKHH